MNALLLLLATALSGLLAGGNFVRTFIEMPAWRETGSGAWAAFSRNADLHTGLVIYPSLAIGAALLTLIGTASTWRRPADAPARLPLVVASLLLIAGLALTALAAPAMLSLRTVGDDPAAIQAAFERFEFWGNLRSAAQITAFFAQLWAFRRLAR